MKLTQLSAACLSLIAALPCTLPAAAAESPTPRKIVSYGGGGWKDGQVNEPCILVNPKDATRLIMFYSGMKLGGSHGAIGKAWATVSNPYTWHEDDANPVLTGDRSIAFEASGVRLDQVIYREDLDEYWIYYTGTTSKVHTNAIGLAICPAGADGYGDVAPGKIKRYEGNPILAPRGQGRDDETHVSQGAIVRDGGRWYSLYSYRAGKAVLPGVRLATSADGKRWTKTPGPDLLTAAPQQRYIEWHQVSKIGDRYVMFYEGYNGGTRWGADVASSASLTSGWQKLPTTLIDQTRWPNYSDETMFHVATPAVYQIGGKWRLYFQAAPAGYYITQHWSLWGVDCDDAMAAILKVR